MVDTEPDTDEVAEGLQRALGKIFTVLRRGDTVGPKVGAGDLTLAQLSILITLLDNGPMRMTELAAHERVRTPTTTVAIRRLEKLGFVHRSRDSTDLRAVLVGITERGLDQYRESLDSRRAHIAAMLARLSADDRDVLARAVAALERLAAADTDEVPSPGGHPSPAATPYP